MEAVPQVLDGNARSLDSPRKGEVERLRVHIRSVLRDVLLSARSVRASHASVPLCLFTDVPEVELHAAVAEAVAENGTTSPLFDVVLPDGGSSFTPRSDREATRTAAPSRTSVERRGASTRASGASREACSGRRPWHRRRLLNKSKALAFEDSARGALMAKSNGKLWSRIGRLLNLASAPFDMTLFVDDDTYFCPDAPLADALESLFLRRGVSTPRAATPVRRLERLAITYVKASIDPARPRGERRRPNMRAPNRVDPN